MSVLSDRAMNVRLTVRQWSARKLDRRVTREVNDQHGASADAGRYNKRLVAKEALAAVQAIGSEARACHYAMTSPWLDDGARLLSAILYSDYTAKMQAFRHDWEAEVSRFVEGYPAIRDAAQADLGDLYSADDYPDARDIEKRFELRVTVYNVPDEADFRVALAEGQADAIRDEIRSATDAAMAGAMRDAWQRTADVAGRMVERLRAYTPGSDGQRATGTFHDSLVGNIADLADILPGLNLARDPALDAIARRLKDELAGYSADTLRSNPIVREETAQAAEDILAHVRGYLT